MIQNNYNDTEDHLTIIAIIICNPSKTVASNALKIMKLISCFKSGLHTAWWHLLVSQTGMFLKRLNLRIALHFNG